MSELSHLFEQNRHWAENFQASDPEYFEFLTKQQKPKYLWIGCADSRVPASQIMGLRPGEIFVHRNIANVVVPSDLSALSVLQYAIEHLKVEHVIVCGHYGCGGVQASISGDNHGLVDNWLKHIEDVAWSHRGELEQLEGKEKLDRLCELNVMAQVENVCQSTPAQEAWARGQKLAVHSWVYDIGNGRLKEVSSSISSYQRKY